MQWIEVLGYIASGMVFTTFWMRTMIPLRVIAIGSNLLFFSYALWGNLLPIAVLHGLLLPLNSLRLHQGLALRRRIHEMASADFNVESLLPFMDEYQFEKGSHPFKQGDAADRIYYLAEGRLRVCELNIDIDKGELVGEIGMFSPDKKRTQTVECLEDSVLLGIDEEKVLQIYQENPVFGLYLLKMISKRLLSNLKDVA